MTPVVVRRRLAVGALCFALAACATRGTITVVPDAAAEASVTRVFVATTRGSSATATLASRARADSLRWAIFDVSVPPDRELGTVTFPNGAEPDPRRDFLTVSARQVQGEEVFLQALNAALAERPPGRRETTLFVHGFNTNLAEGLYRHAQMAHDFRSPGVSVSYSWPSAASSRAYAFDRESALFARDGLEQVMEVIARSRAEDMVIAGHSMGALLVMEAVRQAAIRGSDDVFAKLQAIVLMAPDLDVDVFRQQVAALAPRQIPIYIAVSGRDRALRLSGLLRGRSERLGAIREKGRVASLPGVVVLDVSDIQGSDDPLNHFAVATSPEMIAFISGLDRVGTTMLRDGDRETVFGATINAVTGVTEVVRLPSAR